jgi:hypothetical protein
MPSSIQYLSLPDNYIYISHLGNNGEYLILPSYPDTVNDSMSSTFSSTNALSRSAPVYTYSNSGPRTVQINLTLFRDMMDDYNVGVSNIELEPGQDYVDVLIKKLQSISVPKYNIDNKAVEPPLVAVRLGNEIFIKGIVNGSIALTYSKPILVNNKYSQVTVSFQVTETDPYDASTIEKNGSFRGVTRAMKAGFHIED